MTRNILILIAIVLAPVVSGCGVQGDAYQQMPAPATKSVVYLYRPYRFFGSGSAPIVTCGHQTIELEAGGYYVFTEEGGQITCTAGDAGSNLKFDAHADTDYYVREDVVPGSTPGPVQFTLVNAAVGHEEIAETRLQAPPPPVTR
ncbi:MAG TPA: hypothetical protein VMU16_11075 [Candidatus Binataceae bacterium]|nr:hypothetical protein [Candidatus Binataceae bacterium]